MEKETGLAELGLTLAVVELVLVILIFLRVFSIV